MATSQIVQILATRRRFRVRLVRAGPRNSSPVFNGAKAGWLFRKSHESVVLGRGTGSHVRTVGPKRGAVTVRGEFVAGVDHGQRSASHRGCRE